jgi:hypothetical protein
MNIRFPKCMPLQVLGFLVENWRVQARIAAPHCSEELGAIFFSVPLNLLIRLGLYG